MSVLGGCLALLPAVGMEAAPLPQAGGDCRLAPVRQRIDATLASMRLDREETSEAVDVDGRAFTRVDTYLSGDVDGCVVKAGPVPTQARDAYSWMYDVPDIELPQEDITADPVTPRPLPPGPNAGNTSPRYYARSRFEAADGAGITFLLPRDPATWNGKLFITQWGSGIYTPLRPLLERTVGDLPASTEHIGFNLFIPAMLDRGYAVAYLRRDQVRSPLGNARATLNDGSTLRVTHHGLVAQASAFAEYAQRYVTDALGQRPSRTYWYGHSSGSIVGRLINTVLGANRTADGARLIDGFLDDDVGGGLYLPIAYDAQGRDYLLTTPAERAEFVPQIEIAHQLYNPQSYLPIKRLNVQLLEQKGVGDRHRYYEVRGVSHFDIGLVSSLSGDLPSSSSPESALDLGALISRMTENLDAWVEAGVPPPPSHADAPGFAPAVALPEVACPLGVFHAGPEALGPGGATQTAFVPFDAASQEPINAVTGAVVDVNGNGARDLMEPVDAAWRRLGLLAPGESFGLEVYQSCLRRATANLIEEGFLPSFRADRSERQAPTLLAVSGARWVTSTK